MRESKSLGTPFFLCVGALAFLLTVGVQLYLKGAPMPEVAVARPESPPTPEPELETEKEPATTELVSVDKELSEDEILEPTRPGFVVSGRIASVTGDSIEAADVRLFLLQGDQERELTRLLTDSEGHFSTKLKALATFSTESLLAARVEARIVANGHLPLRKQLDPTPEKPFLATQITLTEGHHMRGRILNHEGDPISNCSVDLYLDCPPGTPRSESKRSIRTDMHGEYDFGWKRGQGLRFIDAEHPTWGKATVSLGALAATEDQDVKDISLDPGGVLAGTVSCKFGGDLLPGVRIDARPTRAHATGKRKWTLTGNDGSFHLSGLVPGQYDLWVEDANAPVGKWKTGQQAIALEVDLVRLVVSVRDPHDQPLPGQRVQFVNIAGNSAASLIETASDTSKGQDALVVFSPARIARASKDAETGERTAVAMRATSMTVPTYEELIDIPEDACRIDHTFTLLSSDELGHLQVRVKGPDGEFLNDPIVTVTSLLTGERVTNLLDRNEDPQTWMSTLTPGSYDLEIEPRDAVLSSNMILGMGTSEPVEIRTGHETALELQATSGGRISLVIHTASGLPETLPVEVRIAPIGSDSVMEAAPRFEAEIRGERRSEIPMGKNAVSYDVLEPGEYRLRIECPGYQVEFMTVNVKSDQLSEEELELERL